jgi:membrane protease YdiL (CAAX protease family)
MVDAVRRHALPRDIAAFALLMAVGGVGVLAQLPVLLPLVEEQLASGATPDMTRTALVSIALLNGVLLLAIAVVVGLFSAPRVGLRSHLVSWAQEGTPILVRLRPEAPIALTAGTLVGGALMVAGGSLLPDRSLGGTVAGVLYGGITEELLLRWGVMAALAWGFTRIARALGSRSGGSGSAGTAMIAAIVASALLFGLLHLPYAATLMPLTPDVVAWTIGLNAAAGIVFGFLFWRTSLEAAMLAHAAAHVAMTLVALPLGRFA